MSEPSNNPGEDWCPWQLAPLRFFPDPTPLLTDAAEQQRKRCESLIRSSNWDAQVTIEYEEDVLCSGEGCELSIVMSENLFSLRHPDPDALFAINWPIGAPDEFCQKLAAEVPKGLDRKVAEKILRFVSELHHESMIQLRLALLWGFAVIKAQPESILAPFVTIPYHSWVGNTLSPRRNDLDFPDCVWDAILADGSKVYSICTAPGPVTREMRETLPEDIRGGVWGMSFPLQRLPTRHSRTKTLRWLEAFFRDHPDPLLAPTELQNKQLLREKVRETCGDISRDRFNEIWQEAIFRTNASLWTKGGRRPNQSD